MKNITNEEYNELLEYRWIKSLNKYAFEFWTKELGKLDILPIFLKEPPIRFFITTDDEVDRQGYCNSIGFSYVSINRSFDENDINSVIRHELIHSALTMMQLKNNDDCAIFKLLCDLYNARFYGLFNNLEAEIYKTCKDDFDKVINILHINNYDETMKIDLGIIIEKIGDKNIVSIDQLPKLKEDVTFILSAIEDSLNYKNKN